ncbi:MAG: hypothetical protein R3293_18635 [Candidatus Promineifilaceae bacterium]|nr:hypothetical protein [Candidatus Promineifilaceae bacterium]
MQDICTYHVEVVGIVDEIVFNAVGPIMAQAERIDTVATRLTIKSDQSGLVGLVRYLHQQGFVLISVSCKQ